MHVKQGGEYLIFLNNFNFNSIVLKTNLLNMYFYLLGYFLIT